MKKIITNYLLKRFFKNVKILKNKKGFSLIEIMVGLGLLVIIGGIATTQYGNYTERAKKGSVTATLTAISNAVGVCIAVGDTATTDCLSDDVNGSLVTKPGVAVLQGEETLRYPGDSADSVHVCYYAVSHKANEAAPTTKAKGVFGIEVFRKSDGKRNSDKSLRVETGRAEVTVAADCTP